MDRMERTVTIEKIAGGYLVSWERRGLASRFERRCCQDFAAAAAEAWRHLDDIPPGIAVRVTTRRDPVLKA